MGSLVDKVMEARRFRDLGVEEYSFDEWANSLLSSLDRSDTDKVLAVISKLSDLTKNNRQVMQSAVDEVSFRSAMVANVVSDVDMDSMKILLGVFANKDFADFTVESELSERIASFLKTEFNSLRPEIDKTTRTADNSKIAARTVDALQTRLGNALGDQQMHGLIPQFQRFYGELTAAERESLGKWFQLEAAGKHPKVGKSMQLAWLSMSEFMNRRDADSGSDSEEEAVASEPRLSELLDHQKEMLALLEDETLPLQARLPIAMSLVSLDVQLPATGVWKTYAMISKAVDQDAKLEDMAVSRIFKVALELESDPAFAEAAGGFAKKWAQAKINRSKSGYYGSYWSSRESPTVGAIRILAKTDNLPTLKKLLATERNTSDLSVLTALVEAGLHSEARKRSQAAWRDSNFFNSLEYGSHAYTKGLEENLPEFLGLFKSDGDRYFAELFFSSFPNSKAAKSKVESTPKERLAEIAKRFTATEFKSKRIRQMAMAFLSDSPEAAAVIREPLKEIAADLKIEQLIENNNSEMQLKMLAAWLGVEATSGNFEPVRKMYRKANGLSEDGSPKDSNPLEDNWEVRQLLDDVSKSISKSFSAQIEEGSTETIEKLLPLLTEFNAPSFEYKLSPELNVLAHLVVGRTDELLKAWESAPKDEEEEDSYGGPDMDEFLKQVQKYADGKKIDNAEERAKLVVDVWSLGAKGKFNIGSGHYQDGVQESCSGCSKSKFGIEQLAELKLLSDEQILELGPQLAELNSVYGEVWRQVAKRQFAAEKFEEACESFRKALEASKEEMKQAKFNRRVEYANALSKLGRDDDAKKQLEKMEPGELLGDNVERYGQLKATLKLE
jgi:tetratricopeptide (TPR) repeat protein